MLLCFGNDENSVFDNFRTRVHTGVGHVGVFLFNLKKMSTVCALLVLKIENCSLDFQEHQLKCKEQTFCISLIKKNPLIPRESLRFK